MTPYAKLLGTRARAIMQSGRRVCVPANEVSDINFLLARLLVNPTIVATYCLQYHFLD